MSEEIEPVLTDTRTTLAHTLEDTARRLESQETVSVREMLHLMGEQGLLLLCMVLMLPFLLPVSVPGVSTVFSVVVILAGISVTFNWLWLPDRIMAHQVSASAMVNSMRRGAHVFARIDRISRPRLHALTHGATMNRVNGLFLIFDGILLIFPLGGVPFSNTLPGISILLLAAGMVQRDGIVLVGGYLMTIGSIIYFSVLGFLVFSAGQRLWS
jgi:hypothetical protein